MVQSDSERERWRLAQLYDGMSEGELENLAGDAGSLSETAKRALRFEIAKRGLTFGLHETPPEKEPEYSKLVTIRKFRDVPDAYLAKGLLDSVGIESFLFDANIVSTDWLWSNAVGGVKLRVREEEAAEALEMLDAGQLEVEQTECAEDRAPERCPNCRSTDIAYQPLQKGLAYVSSWLGFPVTAKHLGWKCNFCGYVWRDSDKAEQISRR
jgi:hypothetical protein